MTHPQQIYDRERISLNIVRLKKGGSNFEVMLSDPDKALELRQGASIDVRDVLRSEHIFSDAKKGEMASDIKKIFSTENIPEVAERIIKEGDFHLTAEQKRKVLDRKINEIINYIHMNALDPKTGLPHPKKRIELAIEQAHVRINMYESITSQTEKVVKDLRPIIPMSFEKVKLRVSIPAQYASRAYSLIKTTYNVKNEAWKSDGSIMFDITAQAGKKQSIFDMINKLTKGDTHITEVKE